MMSFGTGPKRTYKDFEPQIPKPAKESFDRTRDFCLSLGNNVIEDVRMHRIVFCKSMTFRWFADVEPAQDRVILKINRGRKEAPATYDIGIDGPTDEHRTIIRQAYDTLR